MSNFFVNWGHLLTAMVVFAGVWAYVWSVDQKVKRLKQELAEDSDD